MALIAARMSVLRGSSAKAAPAGSAAPAATTPHPADRSDTSCPRAGKSDGASLSTSPFAITAILVAGEPCHSKRHSRTFGSCSKAVDVLFDGSEGVACWTLLMFYLAVVLESGDVVGGGLDAQDEAEFVVNLNRGFAETMLDAGALDPGCELTADLLGELGGDLVAQEGGHVFGFDGQDGLSGKLFIERSEDGLGAEHQIGGVFDLHDAPVVGRSEELEYRTALRGIAVEDLMQSDGREVVGQCLRPLPVVDAQKGVVGQLEADAGGGELASQPAMSVAIELETERTPGGNAQIDQAQVGVDEVEVIMQALTGRRAQERAMGLLAVPGLVSGAGFHRRDDMHQAGMVAARGQHLGNHVLLADLAVGNMLDGNGGTRRQLGGALAHAVTKRLGKSRIIEDADLPRRQKGRHAVRVARPGQGAGDDDPVIAGERSSEALAVTLGQQPPQPSLPRDTSDASILPCLVPAWPG